MLPLFFGEHVTTRSLQHMETARQIEPHDLVEIGCGVVQQALANIYCRRADYNVNLVVLFFHGTKGLADRGRIGNVQCQGFRPASIGTNAAGGLFRAWTIDVGTDRESARSGKSFRRREAYAGCRSRHKSHTAIQPEQRG